VKKLLVGPLLIVLGLVVVACGSSPTLLPTGTATAISPASAAAAIGPTSKPTGVADALLLSAGTYGVGTAIPAGTYEGQSLSDDAYYQIATGPKGKDIVAKSPRLTGQFSLKLTKGQYLEVSGVMKIAKVK
jgi:hypothetical protein